MKKVILSLGGPEKGNIMRTVVQREKKGSTSGGPVERKMTRHEYCTFFNEKNFWSHPFPSQKPINGDALACGFHLGPGRHQRQCIKMELRSQEELHFRIDRQFAL